MEIKCIDYQSTEDFLTAVAKKCLSDLSEEDKQIFLKETDPTAYHFGIGLYIRNNYIYPQKEFEHADNFADIFDLTVSADAYSSKVIKKMLSLLKE